jgi:hypothetical protein
MVHLIGDPSRRLKPQAILFGLAGQTSKPKAGGGPNEDAATSKEHARHSPALGSAPHLDPLGGFSAEALLFCEHACRRFPETRL